MSRSPDDFPRIWQKPTFQELLDCLKGLRVDPPVWNLKISHAEILREQDTTVQHRREIAYYLSTVISSNLDWIEDEDERELLWTEASKRLSERCGRAAMGEITRRWPFESYESPDYWHPSFDLTLREPPLTGDSLGLKTWASSYVLSRLLPSFATTSLSHLLSPAPRPDLTVLELGSGTGLLGLAAACMLRTPVVLTDLPDIVPNLIHNVELNLSMIQSLGGDVETGTLTWGDLKGESDSRFQNLNQFKIVFAADPLYDDNHPGLLTSAIHSQLTLDEDARALVMVAQRDDTTQLLLSSFKQQMSQQQYPLLCIEEGVASGQDDWDEDEESQHIDCWWGIFKRQHVARS